MFVTVAKGYDLGHVWKNQGRAGAEQTADGYYINAAAQAGEPAGRWWGPGAEPLGFTPCQVVEHEPYTAVYQQLDPRTGESSAGRAGLTRSTPTTWHDGASAGWWARARRVPRPADPRRGWPGPRRCRAGSSSCAGVWVAGHTDGAVGQQGGDRPVTDMALPADTRAEEVRDPGLGHPHSPGVVCGERLGPHGFGEVAYQFTRPFAVNSAAFQAHLRCPADPDGPGALRHRDPVARPGPRRVIACLQRRRTRLRGRGQHSARR